MVDQGTELSNGFMMSDFATNGAHDGVQSHVNARVMAKHDITEGVRQEEKGKDEMNEENEGAPSAMRASRSPMTNEKRRFSTVSTTSHAREASTAKSAKRRRARGRGDAADLGALGKLPVEVLELVLLNLDARGLGNLASTCSYFSASGVIERVADALLNDAPRADALMLTARDSRLKALHYCTFSERAERVAACFALGGFHTAAIVDDRDAKRAKATRFRVAAFGRGFHGQLGIGGYETENSPVNVDMRSGLSYPVYTGMDSLSLGMNHNVALSKRGDVITWGLASSGELGLLGTTPIDVCVPRMVVGSALSYKITQVSAGANHTLAIGWRGELFSCGRGRSGQLGHGHFQDAGPFRRLQALNDMNVVNAVAGGSHSICITSDGHVWAWGDCRYGQLGLGDLSFAAAAGWFNGVPWPCLVETLNDLDEPVVQMSAGGFHSIFVTGGGRMFVCGRGKHGALGVGGVGSGYKSMAYDIGIGGRFVRVAANRLAPECVPILHFVRGGDGSIVTNRVQQCSCGTRCRVALAAAGGTHSVVLTACGGVFTSGENAYGQLGHGHLSTTHIFTRVEALRGKRVTAVAAGFNHTGAVVEANGRSNLYLWGRGDLGQLGTGDGRSYSTPKIVKGLAVAPPRDESECLMYQQVLDNFGEEDADDEEDLEDHVDVWQDDLENADGDVDESLYDAFVDSGV